MPVRCEVHPDGVIFQVRANAGARRNAIEGMHDGSIKVSVTQAPERGKANVAIVALLAKALGVRKSQLELAAGATSARKRFLVRGLDAAQLNGRIARAASADAFS